MECRDYYGCVQRVLAEYCVLPTSAPTVRRDLIAGTDQLLILDYGWDDDGRVHQIWMHIRCEHALVLIECNNSQFDIALDFIRAGIPAACIQIGFHYYAVSR